MNIQNNGHLILLIKEHSNIKFFSIFIIFTTKKVASKIILLTTFLLNLFVRINYFYYFLLHTLKCLKPDN